MQGDETEREARSRRRRANRISKPKPKSFSQLRHEAWDSLLCGDCGGFWKGMLAAFVQLGRSAIDDLKQRKARFQQIKKEREQIAKDPDNHPYPRVRRIVMTTQFEVWGTLLICGNTVFVGWQAGLMPGTITPIQEIIGTILENLFTFCFFTELILRTMTMGWPMLLASENWLDVFLVFLGVIVTWILGPAGIQVELLRKLTALRTLRMVRVARSVRFMPEFKEMWALVKGLTESGETLFWVAVMMGCVLYFFCNHSYFPNWQIGSFRR